MLSDILQSGQNDTMLYKEVAELIHKKGISRLIGIGEGISSQVDQFNCEKSFYSSTADFLLQFNNSFFRDETILLKGARAFSFEAISKIIQQKAHETVLEINLNAIVHNLNYFRSKLKAETKIMAMVKAFSYGSGSFEVANKLQFEGIDYVAVAYTDEGILLRKNGIELPMMVMNADDNTFDLLIEWNLEPEIYNMRSLQKILQTAQDADRIQYPIHIKLDTGMHRLGFEEENLEDLLLGKMYLTIDFTL